MRLVTLGCVAFLAACAPRLEAQPFDAGARDAGPGDAGLFTVQAPTDAGAGLVVDATSDQRWVAFDFDTAAELAEGEPGWDVAFNRFAIRSNGGISGDGGVEVARVDAGSLADVLATPPGPWMRDAPDGDDEGTSPDYAFLQGEAWYEYDPRYHTLAPRPFVYVVRTDRARLVKVRILGYYDSVGTSGVLSLEWAPLP